RDHSQPCRLYRLVAETNAFVQFLSDLSRTDKLIRQLAKHIESFHSRERNQGTRVDHDAFSHCERIPTRHLRLLAGDCLPGCRFWSVTSENQPALYRTIEPPGQT